MSVLGLLAALLLAQSSPTMDISAEALAPRVERSIAAGVRWLVDHQEASGAFGSHRSPRPIEVLASFPGSQDAFRVATTALVVVALGEVAESGAEAEGAIDRALEHLLRTYDVKRMSGLEHYNVWALGFGLQAFSSRLIADPRDPRAADMRRACKEIVARLVAIQCLDGGFGYLSLESHPTDPPSFTSMSFTTATILVGLAGARDAGIEVPEAMLERALDSVARCRTPLGVYTYGELWNKNPASDINDRAGAACRTPACQLALAGFARTTPREEIERSLETLLFKTARFQRASLRRPIPHESWYAISGYFYLYGHAYAAWMSEHIPVEARARYAPALAEAVLLCAQPDGSFWDYPLYSYHKPYGTAFALIALVHALPSL